MIPRFAFAPSAPPVVAIAGAPTKAPRIAQDASAMKTIPAVRARVRVLLARASFLGEAGVLSRGGQHLVGVGWRVGMWAGVHVYIYREGEAQPGRQMLTHICVVLVAFVELYADTFMVLARSICVSLSLFTFRVLPSLSASLYISIWEDRDNGCCKGQ